MKNRNGFIGSNGKVRPVGFKAALMVLAMGLSREATSNLEKLIQDIARQYDYNDSAALRTLRTRLSRAARKQSWAQEVLAHIAKTREVTI